MNIVNFLTKTRDFLKRRIIEFIGLIILSIFYSISLISYSPNDPNFIFEKNDEVGKIY